MADVPVTVALAPTGLEVTVYEVMALPPSLSGAVQETEAEASPAVAVTPVGAPGTVAGAFGVTLFDGAEAALLPTAFVAITVNVYVVPFVRPVSVADVPVTVALAPTGLEDTVYEVMALPPSLSGAVQETVAEASPAVAVTPVGALGTVAGAFGVTLFDGAEAALLPTALVATTVNV